MKVVTVLLVIVALFLALVGLSFLSQATEGVGILAGACLLAILARIAQASDHHRELKDVLRRSQSTGSHLA